MKINITETNIINKTASQSGINLLKVPQRPAVNLLNDVAGAKELLN